eukprot:764492-Hanusia_phi.AAC.1
MEQKDFIDGPGQFSFHGYAGEGLTRNDSTKQGQAHAEQDQESSSFLLASVSNESISPLVDHRRVGQACTCDHTHLRPCCKLCIGIVSSKPKPAKCGTCDGGQCLPGHGMIHRANFDDLANFEVHVGIWYPSSGASEITM